MRNVLGCLALALLLVVYMLTEIALASNSPEDYDAAVLYCTLASLVCIMLVVFVPESRHGAPFGIRETLKDHTIRLMIGAIAACLLAIAVCLAVYRVADVGWGYIAFPIANCAFAIQSFVYEIGKRCRKLVVLARHREPEGPLALLRQLRASNPDFDPDSAYSLRRTKSK